MGIYLPKNKNVWMCRYTYHGRQVRESCHTEKRREAESYLAERLYQIKKGIPIVKSHQIKVLDLLKNLLTEYKRNGKVKAAYDLDNEIENHFTPAFGEMKASELTTADVKGLQLACQDTMENSSINRLTSRLRRAFNLALQDQTIAYAPYFPALEENNKRSLWFEDKQLKTVISNLPAYLQGFARFAAITGFRCGIIRDLTWNDIHEDIGLVQPQQTDNNKRRGRFPLSIGGLADLLETQRAANEVYGKEHGLIFPWVFHFNGKRIGDFKKAWNTALKAAGCAGYHFHDLRHTAIRNLRKQGVPDRVIMEMVGLSRIETVSRYDPIPKQDVIEWGERLKKDVAK